MAQIPQITSRKINRHKLQYFAAAIPQEQLASLSHQQGIALPVSDIFHTPVLSALENKIHKLHAETVEEEDTYHTGSLLDIDDIGSFFACLPNYSSWLFHTHEAEDILPITEFQNTFLADRTVQYIRLFVSGKVDPGQIEEACRALVRHNAMVHTVFICSGSHQRRFLAVVLRNLSIGIALIHSDTTDLRVPCRLCLVQRILPTRSLKKGQPTSSPIFSTG